MSTERIAVVGAGISGLGAAWLLGRRFDVTLFEANDDFGGHSNTVDAVDDSGRRAVDTGFIVYNERNYPQLTALFEHLGVATRPSDMSFSASIDGGALEYAGSGIDTLFAQRRNLVRPRFLRMVADILRFNREGKRLLEAEVPGHRTLGEYLEGAGYGRGIMEHYLLPMAAAIWSCPAEQMREFPLLSFLRFFRNHGLLDLRDRPQWRTVAGGSREYVRALLDDFPGERHVNAPVRAVLPGDLQTTVITADGERRAFDRVVIATHADQALALLDNPEPVQRRLLGAFRYQANHAVLHGDTALMPRRRSVWSSWNYLAESRGARTDRVSVTYWMNRLQGLPGDPLLVSLNPLVEPDPAGVHARFDYDHPVFDGAALHAQRQLHQLQGRGGIYFCGSYFGYGFHEDGLRSAVEVGLRLGVAPPWWQSRRNVEPLPRRQVA